ncbi:MAG: lytic murein transglycosylase B [Granulosicoccus sp.]|nr:lytic murein transglycosylase B [Granulosicoccus sp.]
MKKFPVHAALAVILLWPVISTAGTPSETAVAGDSGSGTADNYLHREDVRLFLDELSSDSGIDRIRLAGIVARAQRQSSVLEAISRPAERTLTWREYRPIFLGQERVQQGREFLQEHADLLARANATYAVPPSIIAAIIGVETFYGRITGKHQVLDSLVTLAFDYPPRSAFFRQELREFLMLSEAEGWNAHERFGSYAGAMGTPQFISSSYRQYAVDFDGDGTRDLFNSMADVIGSVANYLAVHGWVAGAPVADPWPVGNVVPDEVQALLRRSLTPTVSGDTVRALGFTSENFALGTADRHLLSVMVLAGAEGDEVWVGYRNFYVISRYNRSQLYVMAVLQLAQSILDNPEKPDT